MPGNGALTQIDAVGDAWRSELPAGTTPASVTVDPTGRFAYVANSGSDFRVGVSPSMQTSGALTGVVAVLTQTAPSSVTVDPSGRFAYVANSVSNTVSAYTIDAEHRGTRPASVQRPRRPRRLPSPSILRANLPTWRTASFQHRVRVHHQSQHRHARRRRGSGACRKQSAIRHRRSFGQVCLHGKFLIQHRLGVTASPPAPARLL